MRLCAGIGLTLAAIASVTACGLSAVGTGELVGTEQTGGPDGATATSTPIVDGGGELDARDVDVPDASACTTTSNTCATSLAAGWSPVALAATRNAACPGGYTTLDVVANPSASAGACTCGCQIAGNDPPTCASGSFVSVVGASTCSGNGQTFTVKGTACTPLAVPGGVSGYGNYAAFALVRGTCVATPVKDDTKLASTAMRACVPPSACVEDVCLGTSSVIGPCGSCIAHEGDVACPSGPFANKVLTGVSTSLTCGGCATCQNNATCGIATVRFYDDAACATPIASRVANGVCNPLATGSAGNNATYFRYDVATNGATCAPTSASTVATGLDQPCTVCCR